MPKQKPNEQVQQIPLSEIRPFKNHPFKVTDDELMQQTIDSIMQVGVLNPAIIRPAPEGGYEMVAGHRRLHAADLAGLKTIPAIVRNLDDDEAVILMVDSNLQRETISPMERAQAYKMKLEALKHQGKKLELQTDSTSPQVGEKSSWAVSIVANDATAKNADGKQARAQSKPGSRAGRNNVTVRGDMRSKCRAYIRCFDCSPTKKYTIA